MRCDSGRENAGHYEAVVNTQTLEQALEQLDQEGRKYNPLGVEPVIEQHIREELLKISGRMGMTGAPTGIIRGVHHDVKKLFGQVVTALQNGHRDLWDGVLPEIEGDNLRVRAARPAPDEEQQHLF